MVAKEQAHIGRASDCDLLGKNKLSYDHHQPIIVFAVTIDDSAGNSAPSAPAVVTRREQVVGSLVLLAYERRR